jgi:hypothetical protein
VVRLACERPDLRGRSREIVGYEQVVVEVVLGRPQAVETEIGGESGHPDILVPHACVGAVLPAVAGNTTVMPTCMERSLVRDVRWARILSLRPQPSKLIAAS